MVIQKNYPLKTKSITFELHVGVGEAALPVIFHAAPTKRGMAASVRVDVTAVVLLARAFSITRQFNLPLQLVTSLSVPVREAQVKVTLSTNQPAASLAHLFQGT
jgi:hypothetical protein